MRAYVLVHITNANNMHPCTLPCVKQSKSTHAPASAGKHAVASNNDATTAHGVQLAKIPHACWPRYPMHQSIAWNDDSGVPVKSFTNSSVAVPFNNFLI